MIDPKFNELPDETETGVKKAVPTGSADENRPERTARTGLSINDTIAGDASLSVGGRGADTSGVRAGSGARGGKLFCYARSAGRIAGAKCKARSHRIGRHAVERCRYRANRYSE